MKPESKALFAYATRLIKPFWKTALFSTLMGMVNSYAAVSLLSIIDHELHAEKPGAISLLASFAGLLLLMFVSEVVSGVGNSFVGQNVIADVRKELVQRILSAPIDELERFQTHRIAAALNHDVNYISDFTRGLSYLVVAGCEVLGCVGYLVYFSPPMFLAAASVAVCAYAGIQFVSKRAYKDYADERVAIDDMQKHYRALVEGAKELRVSRRRRHRFLDEQMTASINRIRDLSNRAFVSFVFGVALDNASFFIIAGTLIGITPFVDKADLARFILVLMYLKGPMGQIVLSLPQFNLALVSFKNIADLSAKFASSEPNLFQNKRAPVDPSFNQLELRGVRYAFPEIPGTEPFALGPMDLGISKGETIFITGENGSGKTTLIKLILGLYKPMEGEIVFNNVLVTDASRDEYRQNFSAIFFDFYLFDQLIESDEATTETVRGYLEQLDIAHKVTIESGALSTLDLSSGQRKRLALIETYLEKRPVIVLDEWAAEQDPTFRRIFYREILPQLKAQGKTLIVVSHDDRYFDAADRLIHIDKGRVIKQVA